MSERRNDPAHFPAVNGLGHRRRKVINLPAENRYDVDPYHARAIELIGKIDRWLARVQTQERLRAERPPRMTDPGE